jgi:hypothetical protein
MAADCTAARIRNPAVVILHLNREKIQKEIERHFDPLMVFFAQA